MGLLWPIYLLLLTAIPLVVLAYVLALRRRRRFAVHYSSLSLIRQAMPGSFRWRRHLPFALMVLAIALLILALSRPFANVTVASTRTTVMLALDVSLSMCADDVDPNRLTVAAQATERFIEGQAPGTRVGIVAFAGIAELIVPPTTDRDKLLDAVANLTTARATAVGSAIARSLDALAEVNPDIAPVRVYVSPREELADQGVELDLEPDVIVLLTDGASNRGVRPLAAAFAARDRGVRVYTIGFGTNGPTMLRCTASQLGGDELYNLIRQRGFGRFGRAFGRGNFTRLDEQTLSRVAEITDAEYYLAESADELLEVFLHDTRGDRKEEGAHGGIGRADGHKRPPRALRRRTGSPLEPAALSRLCGRTRKTTGAGPHSSQQLQMVATGPNSPPDWAGGRNGLLPVSSWRTQSGMDSRLRGNDGGGRFGPAGRVARTVHLCYSAHVETVSVFIPHPLSRQARLGTRPVNPHHGVPTSDSASATATVPFCALMFHPPDTNGTGWHRFERKNGRRPRRSLVSARLDNAEQS